MSPGVKSLTNDMENLTLSESRFGAVEPQFTQLEHVQDQEWTRMQDIDVEKQLNERILVRARIHHVRGTAKNAFIVLRSQTTLIQAVLFVNEEIGVTKDMVKYAASINKESIVDIGGVLVSSHIKSEQITFKTVEIRADFIRVISPSAEILPFQLDDASRYNAADRNDLGDVEGDEDAATTTVDAGAAASSSNPRVTLATRLDHRVVDLRTPANQAIFQLQSAVTQTARAFLEAKGFVEIHSPKLIGAASEGGANVFKVSYFKGSAFLAQSPQFYKQMAICGDMDRVYEVGPVFRAELSFTHRHMTEFTGLDLEMAFKKDYHEVMLFIGRMLNGIFRELASDRWAVQCAAIRSQFPSPEFEFLPDDQILVLSFQEGVAMLRADGKEMGDYDDLSTELERRLGQLVKEKYHTDFYILDKYPLAVRPFYTMPDAARPGYSNSYDFFMRGEEMMSGAQRIHDYELLLTRIKEHGVDPTTVQGYLDAFKYGVSPHAGGGIGLERVLMLYFDLRNIRRTSLFPRDPKRISP